ncbi:hypothetical protein BD779DRAFT_1432085 [Infundibulicybe gibba]|nr:hypothetical protein BD779DRAFT_1432085 [Infundibulicybe gibba]
MKSPTIYDENTYLPSDPELIFGPLDLEEAFTTEPSSAPVSFSWGDPYNDTETDVKPMFGLSPVSPMSPQYDYHIQQPSPTDSCFDHDGFYENNIHDSPAFDNNAYLSNWVNDVDFSLAPSPTSPIPIPSTPSSSQSNSFVAFNEHVHFPQGVTMSPTDFAALHPLPKSSSPGFDQPLQRLRINSISPRDTSLHTPAWASQLWDGPSSLRTPSTVRPSVRHSPLTETTIRQRLPIRRGSLSSGQIFQSSSAPSPSEPSAPSLARSYSRRAESVSVSDDRDATIRRRKRISPTQDTPSVSMDKSSDSPLKSVLRPPKLAPSAWQLYFTDWIQRHQASNTRKLNVAQAAKEAGQEYACLTPEEKEPYKRRSEAAKEAREKELTAYMRTLTPDDIKRENAFRAAQRKAGKSRKSNIKDPNAPKKPLSAYFMFLQRIRANPRLVQDIFGEETETTKQSVLAAAKWRSMTDNERQPYLAQAEQEKMEYEAARRMYEEGTTAYGTNINFSILPGSPSFHSIKMESESENEEAVVDDNYDNFIRS